LRRTSTTARCVRRRRRKTPLRRTRSSTPRSAGDAARRSRRRHDRGQGARGLTCRRRPRSRRGKLRALDAATGPGRARTRGRAAERALARLGGEPTAIGLSGQMHGLVVLDERDRVLRPAILWNDQRTEAECAEIEERVGLARLIQLTGNRALTGFTAPKLLWLRRHEPDTYARIAHVLLPKDYVRLRLTGEHAIDVADASGTLLFDVARRRWSDEMLDALELDPAWLPRALESPEVSGTTAAGVPVAAGAGDQAAAALGVGVDQPGPVSVVLGTSGVVFAALPDFAADPQARVHAFCHAVPGGWHAMGVML